MGVPKSTPFASGLCNGISNEALHQTRFYVSTPWGTRPNAALPVVTQSVRYPRWVENAHWGRADSRSYRHGSSHGAEMGRCGWASPGAVYVLSYSTTAGFALRGRTTCVLSSLHGLYIAWFYLCFPCCVSMRYIMSTGFEPLMSFFPLMIF